MPHLDSPSENLLIGLTIFAGLLALINIFWPRDIVKTTIKKEKFIDSPPAFGVYYLPETILEIHALAKLEVSITADDRIGSVRLVSQEFVISSRIQADTCQTCLLSYQVNPFSNDEVNFRINKNGLLESLRVISDNQTAQIVSNITAAPSKILSTRSKGLLQEIKDKTEKVEMREFKANFTLKAGDTIGHAHQVTWQIGISSPRAHEYEDASFSILSKVEEPLAPTPPAIKKDDETGKAESKNEKTKAVKEESVPGLLFRPRVPVKIIINSKNLGMESEHMGLSFIDKRYTFSVPIRNTPFAKRTQELSVTDGELLSHNLVNPSSVKGFISIPIDIAKAIISIPAQIISFRLDNLDRRKELEVAKRTLDEELIRSRQTQVALMEVQNNLIKSEKSLSQLKVDSSIEIGMLEKKILQLENELKKNRGES